MNLRFRRRPLRRSPGRATTRAVRTTRMRVLLRTFVGNAPPVIRARNKPVAFRSWGLPFLLAFFDGRGVA